MERTYACHTRDGVPFLVWEDPCEVNGNPPSGIPAWIIPWKENHEGYCPWGHKSRTRLVTKPPPPSLFNKVLDLRLGHR